MQICKTLSVLLLIVLMLLMTACEGNAAASTNEIAAGRASLEESGKQKDTEDMTSKLTATPKQRGILPGVKWTATLTAGKHPIFIHITDCSFSGTAVWKRPDGQSRSRCSIPYTGHSETSASDAPTYACVGTRDGIANWQTMQSRLDVLTSRYGIPTEFHSYEGLGHGFGLGTGTVAEGWINDAVAFWERNTQ